MMKPNGLDSIFDPTPDIFTNRVDTVLRTLKEDEPVKKFTLRTGIVALVFTLLFCSIAFAVVLTQGQEWYYNNRFTAYQEHDPSLQQAIITHLETEVPQEPSHDMQNLVNATVQDYAWVAEKNLLTISVCAQLKDSGKYELHPLIAMDADGYWSDTLDPSNPESRVEHWLSTDKGFGPPSQVMNDPSKSLLLADIGGSNILIGDSDIPLFTTTYDSFTGENGTVISVMEIELAKRPEFLPADLFAPSPLPIPAKPSPTPSLVPSPLPASHTEGYAQLSEGATGDSVIALQQALADKGYYHGDIHGKYDESTTQAVKNFQTANSLVSDGVAGPITQSILFQAETLIEANSGQGKDEQDDTLQLANGDADAIHAAIDQYTDKDGLLTLRLPYQVIPFENGNFSAPVDGVLTFKIKIQ